MGHRRIRLRNALAALALSTPVIALACGVCVEDKMAATYDYAVIQQAAAQGRLVVFCEVRGRVAPERLREAAARVDGVDPASVRTSVEPAAVSFALDGRVQGAEAAAAQIRRSLDPTVDIVVLRSVTPAMVQR